MRRGRTRRPLHVSKADPTRDTTGTTESDAEFPRDDRGAKCATGATHVAQTASRNGASQGTTRARMVRTLRHTGFETWMMMMMMNDHHDNLPTEHT